MEIRDYFKMSLSHLQFRAFKSNMLVGDGKPWRQKSIVHSQRTYSMGTTVTVSFSHSSRPENDVYRNIRKKGYRGHLNYYCSRERTLYLRAHLHSRTPHSEFETILRT
ncbi:unnamed protein product [Caretta caretta]